VRKFAELGLLAGTETDRRAKPSKRGAGVALKLAVFDPERLLARAQPLIGSLGTWPTLVAGLYLVLLGTIAFAAHLDTGLLTSARLSDPLFLGSLLVAMLVTAMVHELGHAAAVAYFGGRVKRIGFMLFYLLPALFCDTSDAWRFPFARQRVVVAFAGPATQLAFVSLVIQVLWLGVDDAVLAWVELYVLLNLGMCVYNLIPLVKLDGYWALSAAIDRPNLRAQAIGRASAWGRRVLFGQPVRREPGDAPMVAFGLACAAFGPALILYALLRWEDLLLGIGAAGATIWVLLAAFVAARPVKAAWSAARGRIAQPGAGALSVRMESGAADLVRPGDRVELGDRSLTSGRAEAHGTVIRRDADGWLLALAPGQRRPRGDDVTVRNGDRPVAVWLWHAHLRPALDALWP
jgi:putative peptide zinc metalloprotease protein